METVNLFALQITNLTQAYIQSPHTATAEDLVHLCQTLVRREINGINSQQVYKLLDLAGNKAYESEHPESDKWLKQVNNLRKDYHLRNSPLHQSYEIA